jgi:hypothetical protein
VTWTRITDPEQDEGALPVWFGTRMLGLRGSFGLVLTTGDVLRITCVTALHESPDGAILLDVLLDHAGVPNGVDQAWQMKHYLDVPGATMATVNLAQVVTAVEFCRRRDGRATGCGAGAWSARRRDDPRGQGRLRLPLPGWPAVAVHVGDDRHQAASRLVMISGAAGG